MSIKWGSVSAGLLSLAVLVVAAAQQVTLGFNPDSSWLIVVAERMLEGDQLYRDIFELNPPTAILATLPAALLASLLAIRTEAVFAAMLFGALLASIALFFAILRRADLIGARQQQILWPLLVAMLTLVAGRDFGQREHLALIALLPWLAAMSVRNAGSKPSRRDAIIAGVGAGVTVAFKPHFLLVIGLPLAAVVLRERRWTMLREAECLALTATIIAYAALLLVAFPAFWTEAVPMVADGYLRHRLPLAALLSVPVFLTIGAIGATLLLEREALARSLALMPTLAAGGFLIAVFVQAKGFGNHQYPMIAMALVALATSASDPARRQRDALLGLLLVGAAAGLSATLSARMYLYPQVAALIRSHAPPRPMLLMAGSNLTMAHPLTRDVDGRWAGTRASLWATHAANQLLEQPLAPAHARRLRAQVAEDKALWLADLAQRRPDVIVVAEGEGDAWIAQNPDVAAALRPFLPVGSAQGLKVLVRRRQ